MTGLTEQEARRRLTERGPRRPPSTSRSYASIVRANLFNLPNAVLVFFGVATVALGELADALFLGVVVANTVIGSAQEIRAKRALDRLAALIRPHALVIRDGSPRALHADEVVVGDLVALQPGDQVVAEGRVLVSVGVGLYESILPGESTPAGRGPGEAVLSGAFVAEGAGRYEVTAVGPESYAERLAGEARAFRHPPSPFQVGLGRLVVALVLLGIPLGIALSLTLWLRATPFDDALPTVVAAAINLVPEGLILLSSIAYVAGAVRLSRHGALVQQVSAIESLAAADIVLTDKTGTLTESRLRLAGLHPAPGVDESELSRALGRYAASSPIENATRDALARALPQPAEEPLETVPFSSKRKWGAVRLPDTAIVLGAPELFRLGELATAAARESQLGRRVVAIGVAGGPLGPAGGELPAGTRALGLATIAEELRPGTRDTIAFLGREHVELKVVSGDAPATVAAIAADAGIPSSGPPVDGASLPENGDELRALLRQTAVVGRISPEGKRRIVEALRDDGRHVAMIGDGVNDVPALKASRVAIAQGSGAQMAKTVADLVLVEGDFAAVPRMVREGRQILRNLQRVSKIYATKALFGAFIVLGLGLAPIPYPFLPRQLSLASFFVTGVPPFFLALAPSSGEWRMTSYLRDVGEFAVRAAAAIALGVIASYVLAHEALELGAGPARTVSLSVYVASSLWMIFALEATSPRRARWVGGLCATLLVVYALVFAIGPLRDLFRLSTPDGETLGMFALGVGLAIAALTALGIRPAPGGDQAKISER